MIAGTGRVARIRVRELAKRSDAVAVGIVSPDRTRAEALAEGRLPTFFSLETAMEHAEAVMVCGANRDHAPLARIGLEGGKHVSVDYPMALSLAEADKLIEFAHRVGRVLHVEHIDLLSPWFLAVERNLDRIGDLLSVAWTDLSPRQPKEGDWVFDRASGGTFFVHAAVASRLTNLCGGVDEVVASEQRGNDEGTRFRWRLTAVQARFASGAIGIVEDGIGLSEGGVESELVVTGTEGVLRARNRNSVVLHLNDRCESLPVEAGEGLFAQDVACFIGQVLGTAESYAPLRVVRNTYLFAELVEKSLQEPGRVRLF